MGSCCSGLDVTYDGTSVNGNGFDIKGVKANGPVKNFQGKVSETKGRSSSLNHHVVLNWVPNQSSQLGSL